MNLSGQIITPSGIVAGTLTFDAAITAITPTSGAGDRYILPGFIDTHVHGGGGGDMMDGAEGIATLARFHARHGTTTLLPTSITNPWDQVIRALQEAAAFAAAGGVADGAAIAGVHLEGPFINPARLGAQPPFAVLPEPHLVEEVLGIGIVRLVTLAPELPHARAAALRFAAAGVRVSLGHTAASYDEARATLEAVHAAGGVAGGTHLYNAMGGLEGRAPGVPGALFASPHAFAELIFDTHHVHPGSFLAAYAALGDRLMLITDAMRGAGLGDCESELGGQTVTIRGGIARLAGGGLAGSVLTLDTALANAVAHGVDVVAASRLLSGNPARYLGLVDRGALAVGLRADLVVLDAALAVEEVWVAGRRVVVRGGDEETLGSSSGRRG